ncbi:uncharacterized protein C16orf86 homolog isoform X1 [Ochotona princeps]|uniref:uncharacterized protein C16orf86 homolog isoform X1 n=1 Tax=Ochotona princeps TaxID=9978 RepID=UPI0027145ABF|nr:uncharacterized protein C16orf86 homolog isoform X1 [Ochotona princeps]
MTSAGRQPEAQEEVAVEPAQLTLASSNLYECPVMEAQSLVPATEVFRSTGEDSCPRGPASEPESQEQEPKLEVVVPEERGPRLMVTPVRPGHGPKRKPVKVEVELSPGLLLQREESEGSQSEPSPSPKQHKKAKKRKSLGAFGLLASAAPAPSEVLGPDRKAQRLRPLYQYINYCNPELNQASEEDVEAKAEAKAEAEPDLEPGLVPEEAGVEPLQALLPATAAAELGSGLAMPCISVLLTPMHVLPPGEEPEGSPDAGLSDCLKAEVDKAAQADIDKMLSVCATPLVPPLSPQYK